MRIVTDHLIFKFDIDQGKFPNNLHYVVAKTKFTLICYPFLEIYVIQLPPLPYPPSLKSIYPDIPKFLSFPIAKLPFPLQKKLLTLGLKQVLKEAITEGECDFLKGKWLAVEIEDLNIKWYFSYAENNEILLSPIGSEDVSISGNLNAFILLAARIEDPDTLFFQRKLLIEGDTELGLEIKNLLDSLDIDALKPELRFFLKSAGEFVNTLCYN